MIKESLFITLLSFLILSFIALHFLNFDTKGVSKELKSIATLTQMPQLAFESAKLEPRLRFLQRVKTNRIYPEMLPVDHLDYLYEK